MLFSIIIPCFNAQNTIESCVKSALNQELPENEFEVIVVDDGSTDNSIEIASRYPCKIIRNNSNMGPGVARNHGGSVAKGSILAFTDSDCIVPPTWLSQFKKHFENSDTVAVLGGYNGSAGNSAMERFAFLDCLYRQSGLDFHIELSSTSNFACLKSSFEKVKGFPLYSLWGRDPSEKPFWGNEDMDIAYLLYNEFGKRLRWDRENGVIHHFRSNVISYAKQQAFFASCSIVSYFKYPKLSSTGTSAGRTSAFAQIISIAPLFFFPLGFKWKILLSVPLISYIFLVGVNINFFKFLKIHERHPFPLALYSIYLLIRNVSWALGCFRGIFWGLGVRYGKTVKTNSSHHIANN